ncbi:MAG: divergent polysaccharide deacetylase family protein, partial [Firmicutes bacterium]|nr:divergent polysaccharide deacetylase family protein [Bacillota bacterium]
DSWTSPASVAGRVAAEMGIPTATNQVFLDHYSDLEKVKAQIERLIKRAKRDGQAVGIGHVRPQTYRALVEMLPRFEEEGVVVVPASRIVSSSPHSQD